MPGKDVNMGIINNNCSIDCQTNPKCSFCKGYKYTLYDCDLETTASDRTELIRYEPNK